MEDVLLGSPLPNAVTLEEFRTFLNVFGRIAENNQIDDRGKTPLHIAAEMGNLQVCHFIIENIEDKNPKTNNGVTPFHLAARDSHFQICEFIMENVKDKNPKSDSGFTPLHCAARWAKIFIFGALKFAKI